MTTDNLKWPQYPPGYLMSCDLEAHKRAQFTNGQLVHSGETRQRAKKAQRRLEVWLRSVGEAELIAQVKRHHASRLARRMHLR